MEKKSDRIFGSFWICIQHYEIVLVRVWGGGNPFYVDDEKKN